MFTHLTSTLKPIFLPLDVELILSIILAIIIANLICALVIDPLLNFFSRRRHGKMSTIGSKDSKDDTLNSKLKRPTKV